jgi:hypothetical protein
MWNDVTRIVAKLPLTVEQSPHDWRTPDFGAGVPGPTTLGPVAVVAATSRKPRGLLLRAWLTG